MWTELRVSWVTLFLLTLSAAAKQRRSRRDGGGGGGGGGGDDAGCHVGPFCDVSSASWVMLVAHWLYVNACQKGEESVPYTWDIFHEKWGWMLIFWNVAGVPFLYCANSFIIAARDVEISASAEAALIATLLAAYYVWDTAQSQRTRFRMRFQGLTVERPWAFPVLPWGTLASPRSIDTARGSPLLISGWVGMARKIHYTADAAMACCWALACGSLSPLRDPMPFLYPAFFLVMIVHRVGRDEKRCREKYGRDWERYKAAVPYCWIPGVV
jgi:delta24(24(1))-sterol reductase